MDWGVGSGASQLVLNAPAAAFGRYAGRRHNPNIHSRVLFLLVRLRLPMFALTTVTARLDTHTTSSQLPPPPLPPPLLLLPPPPLPQPRALSSPLNHRDHDAGP